jgi:hypothetical protein
MYEGVSREDLIERLKEKDAEITRLRLELQEARKPQSQ